MLDSIEYESETMGDSATCAIDIIDDAEGTSKSQGTRSSHIDQSDRSAWSRAKAPTDAAGQRADFVSMAQGLYCNMVQLCVVLLRPASYQRNYECYSSGGGRFEEPQEDK